MGAVKHGHSYTEEVRHGLEDLRPGEQRAAGWRAAALAALYPLRWLTPGRSTRSTPMTPTERATQRERVLAAEMTDREARRFMAHRIQRCPNTGLTKPECHCRICVDALVRANAR